MYALDVFDCPCNGLVELLQGFPYLQHLRVYSPDAVQLVCPSGSEESSDLALLKERMMDEEFHPACEGFEVTGTGEEIRDALACLPALPLVEAVTIQILDDLGAQTDSLELLPHVFPNLASLTLDDDTEEPDPDQGFDMGVLDPLAACPELHTLRLYAHVDTTTECVLELCVSLGHIVHLDYSACEGVNHTKLVEKIQRLGRTVDVVLV